MTTELRPWHGPLAASRFARLPPPADTDDGNLWTTGRCWLWCGREQTRVLWIGTGKAPGGVTAHLFACAPCAQELGDQVLAAQLSTDLRKHSAHADVSPSGALVRRGGRHRRLP